MLKKDYEYKHPSPSSLLEIFPEGEKAVKRNLRIFKQREKWVINGGEKFLWDLMEGIHERDNLDDFQKDFWIKIATHLFYDRPLKTLGGYIHRLERFLKAAKLKDSGATGEITEQDIEKAKNFPMNNLVEINRAGFALCPFHNEKHPSLKVYKDNTWYCYSCRKGTDTIDFITCRDGVDFITAVKSLL